MEAEILQTLKEIKGMLFLLLVGFGLLFALMIAGTVSSIYISIRDRLKSDFTGQAKELFEGHKYNKVIKLCEKEIKIFPRSAEANWWLARAYSELGNDLEALRLFKKVTELEPTWEGEYVSPYVKEINERINNR